MLPIISQFNSITLQPHLILGFNEGLMTLKIQESGGLGQVQASGFSARVTGNGDVQAAGFIQQLSPETSARNGFTGYGDHFTDEETELSQGEL